MDTEGSVVNSVTQAEREIDLEEHSVGEVFMPET